MLQPPEYTQALKINWAKECFAGAALSIVFTLMAKNSGAEGVVQGDIADQLHQVIITGGITMAIICGIAGLICVLRDCVMTLTEKVQAADAQRTSWFGPMQTAKFIKIFLP